MRFDVAPEPIIDDDEAIRAAVADADPHALLVSVAHLTGDRSILRDDLRPDQAQLIMPGAGLSEAQVAEAHQLAAQALIAHRDRGGAPAPCGAAELAELVDFLAGDPDADTRVLLREELALDGDDHRAPDWRADELAPGRTFRVVIVGAGMSGIVAAHRLLQAGVEVVIFDKNDDVGGTWFENTYPGCRVDVPNHLYSYSFLQTIDWPQAFSSQQVLLDYFRGCADRLGLRDHIRFGTEVLGASFDEGSQRWSIRTRDQAGNEVVHEADALVSAVGQLNQPNLPDIEGRDRFAGDWFHSARWRHDLDLTGKRVAVIGTGASAAQFIPAVVEQAGEVTIYQRTPPWLIPTPDYHAELPEGLHWVLRHIPDYVRWDRLWLFWRMHEGLLPAAEVDPEWWAEHDDSVSMLNEFVRQMFVAHLEGEITDAELLAKVRPSYPPIAKRVVRDNGAYTRALQAPNVEVVTDAIAEITEKGVRTVDGIERVADVLIYGTGFQASRFLTPMRITGVGGADLHERWGGDARAYLGITVPGFPNLFLLYGPNTNIVINGSIIYFSECEAHYIVDAVRTLLAEDRRSLEVRTDVHDAFNERVDEANRRMAWGAAEVNSWYKNAAGRVAQNWPFSLLEYWQRTRRVEPADYILR